MVEIVPNTTKLQGSLARLGAEQLSHILGEPTIKLLELLDVKSLTPARLAELILRQTGPEGLLFDRSRRREILFALSRTDADHLSQLLQLDIKSDPWSSLSALTFRHGHPQTNTLFTFFGCQPPNRSQDNRLSAEKVIEAQYPLFKHQQGAYRETLQFITTGEPPRVLLHMPTGSGKTRTAMNVITHFLREKANDEEVVVWLAYTEELCEQAAEEFDKTWTILGDRNTTLFRHFGPYRVDLDQVRGGLLIGGLKLLYQHSLSHQSAFLRLARRVPLVIMDEAHQAIAPTYNHLLNLLAPDPRTAILGLSATPGRSWLDPEEDLKLASFFSRNKVTLRVDGYANPVEFLQREGYLAQVEYVPLPYAPGADFKLTAAEREELQLGLDLPDTVISRLAVDHKRNFLILRRVMDEADRSAKMIVFACSVEHANVLANLLRVKGYRAAAITSSTSSDYRRQTIEQYRNSDEIQILTNYGVLTTGFDAPKTNVAVITRPTRSVVLYSQMVGRAARGPKAGGNRTCRIVTVVDEIPGFRSVAEAFTFWEDIWVD